MALFLYRFLLLTLSPLLLFALVIRSINHPAYRQRLLERLGFSPKHLTKHSVIVHAASVGEVIAVKAYVDHLLAQGLNVTVTTFTPTGSAQVIKQFGDAVQHCYLPLDIWPCTYLFLKRIKPKAIVLMETELWPNIIAQANTQDIPLQLINARLSEKSIKSYAKFQPLVSSTLKRFDRILCQSEESYTRFITLGANKAKCQVSGNLKYDLSNTAKIDEKSEFLSQLLPSNRTIWLVASTHEGDEKIAISTFKELSKAQPELLLILVPRHPERFTTVYDTCVQSSLKTFKRSEELPPITEMKVWLLDSLGELMSAYQLADFVTIGGTFSTIGGHNPLEPALYQKPIIVGPDMKNFNEISAELIKKDGLIQIKGTEPEVELCNELSQLIELPQLKNKLGINAYNVVKQNQGASKFSAQTLIAKLKH